MLYTYKLTLSWLSQGGTCLDEWQKTLQFERTNLYDLIERESWSLISFASQAQYNILVSSFQQTSTVEYDCNIMLEEAAFFYFRFFTVESAAFSLPAGATGAVSVFCLSSGVGASVFFADCNMHHG